MKKLFIIQLVLFSFIFSSWNNPFINTTETLQLEYGMSKSNVLEIFGAPLYVEKGWPSNDSKNMIVWVYKVRTTDVRSQGKFSETTDVAKSSNGKKPSSNEHHDLVLVFENNKLVNWDSKFEEKSNTSEEESSATVKPSMPDLSSISPTTSSWSFDVYLSSMNEETSFEEKFLGVRTRIGNSGEEEEMPDVEIVDDRPEEDRRPPQKAEAKEEEESEEDELEGYSEKVKKRINKLRYQQHEERRQREAAEKMREEAVRVAQNLQQQNQQYQDVIRNGEAMLVTQIKDRAALAVEKAKGQYASAHEAGETDKLLEAQDALIAAQAELR